MAAPSGQPSSGPSTLLRVAVAAAGVASAGVFAALSYQWYTRKARERILDGGDSDDENAPHPLITTPVPVLYADDTETCAELVRPLLAAAAAAKASPAGVFVLGLDAEWKPNTKGVKNKLALLQLASNDVVVLLHLFHMETLPDELVALLEDPRVLKSGVGVAGDVKKLRAGYNVGTRGAVELRLVALAYDHSLLAKGSGLKAMCNAVLGLDMEKDVSVQCSNWELRPLSADQTRYAAADAWAGLRILEVLYETHANVETSLAEFAMEFVDRKIKARDVSNRSNGGGGGGGRRKDPARHRMPIRKTPLYDNCRMEAPDGELLCNCSKDKIEWYASRNLGEIINDDPLTIRLNFEPNGRGHAGDAFYLANKSNECVHCGADENLCRFHIVPLEYRKLFPIELKSHSSHDVLLLCQSCHLQMNAANDRFKAELSAKYDVPLNTHIEKYKIKDSLNLVKKAAVTLQKHGDRMPDDRREQMYDHLREHFGRADITAEDIETAAALDVKIVSAQYVPHAQLMLEAVGDLQAFIRMWRQHFIDTDPQNMLPYWSVDHVDHPLEQEGGKYFEGGASSSSSTP